MTIKTLSLQESEAFLASRNPLIVDIRDEQSFNEGHLPGAMQLSKDKLQNWLKSVALDQTILVCCYHGMSSQVLTAQLTQVGFEEVYNLEGGYNGWKAFQAQHKP